MIKFINAWSKAAHRLIWIDHNCKHNYVFLLRENKHVFFCWSDTLRSTTLTPQNGSGGKGVNNLVLFCTSRTTYALQKNQILINKGRQTKELAGSPCTSEMGWVMSGLGTWSKFSKVKRFRVGGCRWLLNLASPKRKCVCIKICGHWTTKITH
jgi:hypothetical protein